MKEKIVITIYLLIAILLLSLFIKGDGGTPIRYQYDRDISLGGPFESSNSISRYVLTEAMVENKKFSFNDEQAEFASPDVSEFNGKYFSIFTPGVSFLGIPFYLLGKFLYAPQLMTFLSVAFFAVLNSLLVIKIAMRLGTEKYIAVFSGYIFLFASNALSYSLTYTQHHASVTIILLALLNSFMSRTLLKNIELGLLAGIGFLLDIPNLIMLIPFLLYVLSKHINIEDNLKSIKLKFSTKFLGIIFGLIPLLLIFMIYNYQLTHSIFTIGQFLGRSNAFSDTQIEKFQIEQSSDQAEKKDLPLNSRYLLRGFDLLLVSNERGILYYSPILIIGLFGLIITFKDKEKKETVKLIVSVIALNILLYAMFHDPWGGWSFGSRYLIPTTALVSITIGKGLDFLKNKIVSGLILLILFAYSLFISFAGALTTNLIPPRVEAVNLANPIPYTYEYNFQLINKGFSSSLIYNLFFKNNLTAQEYFLIIYSAAMFIGIIFLGLSLYSQRKSK